jgi:D-alanyl-D-alanine carboxypeptidase
MALSPGWQRPWRRLGIATVALAVAQGALLAPVHARAVGRGAVLVVDANTGRTLYERSADALRYPASLVKLMTLYMVFEQIQLGRLTYRTRIRFSDNAAGAAPSRLGVEAGTEIDLIDAVKALITKSANDVAVAIAEHIAGSEARFAQMMTQKARQLGMQVTTFRNASGLPDPEQVTTAREMIILALRLQDDFPTHYPLFATRTFTYDGATFRNHNTLLFRYRGLDGMKTGYIRASGFNLVASVRRGRKHVVAVVFGGRTAAARNAAMRRYLDRGLRQASETRTRKRTVALVARAKAAPASPPPAAQPPAPPHAAAPGIAIARVRPVLVPHAPHAHDAPKDAGKQPASIEGLLQRAARADEAEPKAAAAPHAADAFHIQIGAFQSQGDAERRLAWVRERAGAVLGDCTAMTSPVKLGAKVLYRARYAGFHALAPAAKACDALKRLSIDCLVLKAN